MLKKLESYLMVCNIWYKRKVDKKLREWDNYIVLSFWFLLYIFMLLMCY